MDPKELRDRVTYVCSGGLPEKARNEQLVDIVNEYHRQPGFLTGLVSLREPFKTWLINQLQVKRPDYQIVARPGTGIHRFTVPFAGGDEQWEIGSEPITMSWEWAQMALMKGCDCRQPKEHEEEVRLARFAQKPMQRNRELLEKHQNALVEATPEVMAEYKRMAEDTKPGKRGKKA